MRIVIINGSHRHGNTELFADYAASVFLKKGNTVDTVTLLDITIERCSGCLSCEESGTCVIDDAFTKTVRPLLEKADAFVFASPVYFNCVSSLMKNFIDRTNCLYNFFQENPKKVAVFLVGQLNRESESANAALNYLKEYFAIMNFSYVDEAIIVTARDCKEMQLSVDMKSHVDSWFKLD